MNKEILKAKISEAGLRDNFIEMADTAFTSEGKCLICCTPGCAICGLSAT